jgi:hypothetical protein
MPEPNYSWLAYPEDPGAADAVVSDFKLLATGHEQELVIANLLHLTPELYFQMREDGIPIERLIEEAGYTTVQFAVIISKLHKPPKGDTVAEADATRFQANVEFTTGRQMLKVRGALDKGIRKWAVDAANSHLYRYHRREFERFEEMIEAIFEDQPEASTRSDVNFIAGDLYAFAMAHGLEHVDQLYGDGTIEKARAAVPLLRGIIRDESPAAVAQAQAIVEDVLHLTGTAFKAKYKPVPPDEHLIKAIDYTDERGGILVIEYKNALDRLTIERRLGGALEWHAGTGHEPVLAKLARIEAKGRRRRKAKPPLTKARPRKKVRR